MSATVKNKHAQIGADFVWPQQLLANDQSTPIDITGHTFTMTIYDVQGGETTIHTADTGGGEITLTDPTLGKYKIRIPKATINTFDPGSYFYILLWDNGTDEKDLLRGDFTVLP